MRSVAKWFSVSPDVKCARYISKQDIRCYRPPVGYECSYVGAVDRHPLTDKKLPHPQWWVFITREADNEAK